MKKTINKNNVVAEANEYVIDKRVAKVTSLFKKDGKRTLSDAFIEIIKREK